MQKTRVLLDFDGVVLKNHPVHRKVVQLCVEFVEKRTKRVRKSIDASALNRHLYTKYGHTALGLNEMGFETSKDEFNRFVYGRIDVFEHLRDVRYTHAKDVRDLERLRSWIYAQEEDQRIDISFFSNAPDSWTTRISKLMVGEELPSVADRMGDRFKPQKECYAAVEDRDDSQTIVFLDDSWTNVANSPDAWNSILYREDGRDLSQWIVCARTSERELARRSSP